MLTHFANQVPGLKTVPKMQNIRTNAASSLYFFVQSEDQKQRT
jgi:hypothetical protein